MLKLPYPTNRDNVVDRLLQERLIDVVDGSYAIRRLGGLVLAKRLDEFPDIARKMGHFTVLGSDLPITLATAMRARRLIGVRDDSRSGLA